MTQKPKTKKEDSVFRHLKLTITYQKISLYLKPLFSLFRYRVLHCIFGFLKGEFLLPNHCVKSVQIRSFSGPYFPAFGLNTEKCGKIRTSAHFKRCPLTLIDHFEKLNQFFFLQLLTRILDSWFLQNVTSFLISKFMLICKVVQNFINQYEMSRIIVDYNHCNLLPSHCTKMEFWSQIWSHLLKKFLKVH